MNSCPGVGSEKAGKAESCKGCPNAKICSTAKIDPDIEIIKKKMAHFKLIVAVMSGKGGVGKSSISKMIAENLFKSNKTVLVDLDFSGPSIPRLTNTLDQVVLNPQEEFFPIIMESGMGTISVGHIHDLTQNNEDAVIYDGNIKNSLIKILFKNCNYKDYDIMVLDTPPNITDEHLALVHYIQLSCAILVTTPSKLAINDVNRQFSFCKKTNITVLGIIENMKNIKCKSCKSVINIHDENLVKSYAINKNIEYLGSIPLDVSLTQNLDRGLATNTDEAEEVISNTVKLLEKNFLQ
ncbi:hypothetical protein NUSPORA_00774 [Nucleospora cyclopteri]